MDNDVDCENEGYDWLLQIIFEETRFRQNKTFFVQSTGFSSLIGKENPNWSKSLFLICICFSWKIHSIVTLFYHYSKYFTMLILTFEMPSE